jgi:hypothetical protein
MRTHRAHRLCARLRDGARNREPEGLLAEPYRTLNPRENVLFAEPTGHVRTDAFEVSLQQARKAGSTVKAGPSIRRGYTADWSAKGRVLDPYCLGPAISAEPPIPGRTKGACLS